MTLGRVLNPASMVWSEALCGCPTAVTVENFADQGHATTDFLHLQFIGTSQSIAVLL
jgi:hypothetical protein